MQPRNFNEYHLEVSTGAAPPRFGRAGRGGAVAAAAIVLMGAFAGLPSGASPTPPNPAAPASGANAIPFSWPQYKQTFGAEALGNATLDPNSAGYVTANPGVISKVPGTYWALDYMNMIGVAYTNSTAMPFALDDGTELRGEILGDVGGTEPPASVTGGYTNHFLDDSMETGFNTAGIASWVSPLWSISEEKFQKTPVATFDDNNPAYFTTTGFNKLTPDPGAVNQECYTDSASETGTDTATWTLTAPSTGYFGIWIDVPADITTVTGGGNPVTNASYTITDKTTPANIITPITAVNQAATGWIYVGGGYMTAGDTIKLVLSNAPSGWTAADSGEIVVADAAELATSTSEIVDNTDPPFTAPATPPATPFAATTGWVVGTPTINATSPLIDSDYYGADYLSVEATPRSAPVSEQYAFWSMPVTVDGVYNVSAWFPSQTDSTNGQDTHVDDAEYSVEIYQTSTPTNIVYTSAPIYVDQTLGGQWVNVGGPYDVAAGYTVVLTLDNTTADTIPTSGTASTNPIVVADAAELTVNDGYVSSSPVAVNVSDYPELRFGYGTGAGQIAPAPLAADTGGGWLQYVSSYLESTGVVSAFPTAYPGFPSAGTALTASEEEYYGPPFKDQSSNPFPPNPITRNTYFNNTAVPIAQVVYFGRTENETFSSTTTSATGLATIGPAQTAGAMYAVDGLNGNIIWKYGFNDTVVDVDDPTFSDTGTWTSETTPSTNYIGSNYLTAAAVASTLPVTAPPAGATATATWTLPIAAGSGAASYYVLVHFPTPPGGTSVENYLTDATYGINAYSATAEADQMITVTGVNQNTAGASNNGWYTLTNPNTTNGSFSLDANNQVVLYNVTQDDLTPTAPTIAPVAVADAVEFVPVGAMGTISSTPVVVRDMDVITSMNTATDTATYEPRDVVVFADDSGKVYCVDAAGNGDGDDTILDSSDNPVSFDSGGNPVNSYTGDPYVAPFSFHIKHYGTTHVYWIWQPSASPSDVLLHNSKNPDVVGSSPDTVESAPDTNRDMPEPAAFELNSPTVALAQVQDPQGDKCYAATIFIGNTNGVLYCLDARGAVPVQSSPDSATGYTESIAGQPQYRLSVDPSMATPNVEWWFKTGAGIAYAPAFDPSGANGDGAVYVTTYNPNNAGEGRLYAVDATYGPVGNGGAGPTSSVTGAAYNSLDPASYNYNVNPVTFWSFPDAWGAVKDNSGGYLATDHAGLHVDNSDVGGSNANPADPLGDMCGSPTLENIDSGGKPQVLVCANDPGFGTNPGSTTNGRVYSVSQTGAFNWAYPATGAGGSATTQIDPNTIGSSSGAQYAAAYQNSSQSLAIGAFTQDETSRKSFCSSSVSTALITFPAAQVNVGTTPYASYEDVQLPMAYVGTLDGNLLALNLNGTSDQTRFIYYLPVSNYPIETTPAVLPGSIAAVGSAVTGSVAAGSHVVGGTVWVADAADTLYEVEAAPYDVPTTGEMVNTDWAYTGVGGVSSPCLASFDASVFSGIQGQAATVTGDSEWVYIGGDNGYCYGFTPNSSSGVGFTPGSFIPPSNQAPATGQQNLNASLQVCISATPPPLWTSSASIDFDTMPSATAASTPFDWGQTAYIYVFGVPIPPGQAQTNSVLCTVRLSPTGGLSLGGANTSAIYQTTNFPSAAESASLFPFTGAVVRSQPIASQTPGSKITANATITYRDSTNATHTITTALTAHYDSNGNSTVPPVQGTMAVLNPLAVVGGANSADGQSKAVVRALGPISGVAQDAPFSAYQMADGNGNEIPVTQPPGGAGGSLGTNQAANGNVNHVNYTVAVGLGEIAHGTSGDSGVNPGADPASSAADATDANLVTGGAVDAAFGQSLLLVADRSATGVSTSGTNRPLHVSISSPAMGWNDNSGQGGPGAEINPLSWDVPAVCGSAAGGAGSNSSPDYPDIPSGDVSCYLLGQINPTATAPYASTSGDMQSGTPTLPICAGTVGDSLGTRTIYPAPALVKVTVPKFQPANLEAFLISSSSQDEAGSPGAIVAHAGAVNSDTPQGYKAGAVRVTVSATASGALRGRTTTANNAYRVVQIWAGVPVDMSMSIDQPTIDVGAATAGMGIETGTVFAPYTSTAHALASIQPSVWAQDTQLNLFQPVTVRNNGNVNLLNVHFDQQLAGPDVVSGAIPSYLQLTSDQNQAPFVALNPNNWTDSLSFIPTIDNGNLLLTGQANLVGGTGSLLVRSSVDPDIYTPNPNEYDINGNPPSARGYYNATLHKQRPGDQNGSILTVPDEPHDGSLNPEYAGAQNSVLLGVAVPYGTPVGTYYGTLSAFEGSDPFAYPAAGETDLQEYGAGYSSVFTGPTYANVVNPTDNPAAEQDLALSYSSKQPQQYYANPGTQLKVTVTENRFTDGPTMPYTGGVIALPDGDKGINTVTNATSNITIPSNDLQPVAFRYNGGTYATDPFGLMFISDRDTIKQYTTNTLTSSPPYDLFTSALAPSGGSGQGPLSVPTGAANGTWWTKPTDQTNSVYGSVRSPFVLNDSTGLTAFFVSTSTGGGGQTEYTIQYAPIANLSAATGLSLGAVSQAYISTNPIYGLKAVHFGTQLLLFWHTRVRGHSAIYYLPYVSGTAAGKQVAQVLPVSGFLVDVSGASPVVRTIDSLGGGSLVPVNYLDVTYSGTSTTGDSDIYTSRYQFNAGSLTRVPIVPQSSTASLTPMIVPLLSSSKDPTLYHGQNIDWVADPTLITVDYTYAGAQTTMINGASNPHYTYDSATGEMIYTNVAVPANWSASASGTLDVYVNPALGTVRFSTAPANNAGIVSVACVPLSVRVTYQSGVNTQPIAFLDDATKPGYASQQPLGSPRPVLASREWYIYRKSGTSAGTSPAAGSTLYYDTRRLTVDLAALNSNVSSLQIVSGVLSKVTVLVYADSGYTAGGQDETANVDIDPTRARIYFPSYMEGLYVTVQFIDQSGVSHTTGGSGSPVQLTWQDEPYVNTQNPAAISSGERTVPMTTSINESDPCAFLDPTAGFQQVNSANIYVPHRVWLFWTSGRNAASAGSDIYFEALDPKFSPDIQ